MSKMGSWLMGYPIQIYQLETWNLRNLWTQGCLGAIVDPEINMPEDTNENMTYTPEPNTISQKAGWRETKKKTKKVSKSAPIFQYHSQNTSDVKLTSPYPTTHQLKPTFKTIRAALHDGASRRRGAIQAAHYASFAVGVGMHASCSCVESHLIVWHHIDCFYNIYSSFSSTSEL